VPSFSRISNTIYVAGEVCCNFLISLPEIICPPPAAHENQPSLFHNNDFAINNHILSQPSYLFNLWKIALKLVAISALNTKKIILRVGYRSKTIPLNPQKSSPYSKNSLRWAWQA